MIKFEETGNFGNWRSGHFYFYPPKKNRIQLDFFSYYDDFELSIMQDLCRGGFNLEKACAYIDRFVISLNWQEKNRVYDLIAYLDWIDNIYLELYK